MSIVDFHPEDLIDKHARGELSESEEERLRAHLAVCKVCRFEQAARQDFAVASMAVKTLHDPSASGAIDRLFPRAAGDGPDRKSPPPFRRPRVSHLVAAIAVALMITSAAAGAGLWPRLRPFFFGTPRLEPAPPAPARLSPVGQAPRARPPIDVTVPERKTSFSASPAARSLAIREPRQRLIREVRGFGSTATPPPVPQSAPPSPPPRRETPTARPLAPEPPDASRTTPESLFASANAARRQGDGALAVDLYRELQRRFPESNEARMSRATLGRLFLDRGHPGNGLKEFQEYLSSGGGELEEEALVGKALALQNLGHRDAEMTAWNEVLKKHPSSVHGEQARARMSVLAHP